LRDGVEILHVHARWLSTNALAHDSEPVGVRDTPDTNELDGLYSQPRPRVRFSYFCFVVSGLRSAFCEAFALI
jgi:hypothetical protein